MIGGLNTKYKYNDKLNLSLSASNFRSKLYQEFIPGYDSLVVNQVDRSFNLSGNYLYTHDGQTNKIVARVGFQSGKNITLDQAVKKISKTYVTGSYSFDNKKYDLSLTPKLALYYYQFTEFGNFQAVPSITAKKYFLNKKLNTSYNLGLVLSRELIGLRNRLCGTYKISDKQGVSLQLFLVNNISSMNSFTEFQMELRWYFNF